MNDLRNPHRREADHWHISEFIIPAGCFFLLVSSFAVVSLLLNIAAKQVQLNEDHRVMQEQIVNTCGRHRR